MSVSEYWYQKKSIPQKEKDFICKIVKGTPVGSFVIKGTTHNLLQVDGSVFKRVFIKNRKYLYKGDYTAPSNENNYDDSINYLSEDGLAGFAITNRGWLVSLFSNYQEGGFVKAVRDFIIKDAYKLVCIVTNTDEGNALIKLYKDQIGFKKYVTTIDDTDIMRDYYGKEFIDNFISKNGTPFHVFMIGPNAVGTETAVPSFSDYFEAEAFVDRTVILKSSKE